MKKQNIHTILLTAFVLRLLTLLINNYLFTLPQGEGDAIGFEISAYYISISDYSNIDYIKQFSSGVGTYILLMSYIYWIFGRYPFLLGFSSVILGTYLVYLVYRASLLLWNDYAIAKKSAWFLALFPMIMVESGLVLRELPVMVFSMLGIIAFIKFWKYKQKSKIFGFIFYTFLATLFHSGMIFILFGFLVFINFYAKGSNIITKLFSLLLVVTALYIMNETGLGTRKIGGSFDKSYELLQKREHYHTAGGSRYPNWMRLSGGTSDLLKIPVRYVTFLFSPLIPWLVRSIWHTIGLVDAILYFLMFYIIIKHRKIFKYNDTALAIFIMILLTALVFSLGTKNVGTAIRHRAKIAPLLIILAVGMNRNMLLFYKQQYAIALKKWQEKKRKI